MEEIFSRNSLYWGSDRQKLLSGFCTAVFGLGGVGGFCAEMLARAGMGKLILVDFDIVSPSNINRQIAALNSTVGMKKTELFYSRLKDINPNIELELVTDFYSDKLNEMFISKKTDFIADAIDTIRSKISLLEYAHNNGIKVISSMGAGNRINPEKLYISDISEIRDKNAPFVSNVLYQLKKRDITSGIAVVASDEKPFVLEKISELEQIETNSGEKMEFKKIVPSSTPFVASVAGIYMASYIVRELLNL
ncbi:MAG: ThiF family adenylyltransferase [Candidatus Gastranaerophilales bacterium]|nr:ThiF family adenylyltransferase [Candidatus Gastranaerophilales bacterium]